MWSCDLAHLGQQQPVYNGSCGWKSGVIRNEERRRMSQVSEHQPRYLRCVGTEQKLCIPMPLRKSHFWGGHQDGEVTDWGPGSASRVTAGGRRLSGFLLSCHLSTCRARSNSPSQAGTRTTCHPASPREPGGKHQTARKT